MASRTCMEIDEHKTGSQTEQKKEAKCKKHILRGRLLMRNSTFESPLTLWSVIAFTLPKEVPITTGSPTESKPHCTNTSAITPLPLSIDASSTVA